MKIKKECLINKKTKKVGLRKIFLKEKKYKKHRKENSKYKNKIN